MNRAVIFDGDDTLWRCEPLYDRARARAAAIVAGSGLDGAAWVELQQAIDLELVGTMGLSDRRFARSFEEAHRQLCRQHNEQVEEQLVDRLIECALAVFARRATALPNTASTLKKLRSAGFVLGLLTQGERWVQELRIKHSNLAGYFDRVKIVPLKDAKAFASILRAMKASPGESWSIGNSVPSDINPAIRLGMSAVWIPAHVWAHEQRETRLEVGRVTTAEHLADVPGIIDAAVSKAS